MLRDAGNASQLLVQGTFYAHRTLSQGSAHCHPHSVAVLGYLRAIAVGNETTLGSRSGCVAVGETRREVLKLIRDGIELHIEALREAGEPVPPPTSKSELIKVRAA
jgi:hypothetical protein